MPSRGTAGAKAEVSGISANAVRSNHRILVSEIRENHEKFAAPEKKQRALAQDFLQSAVRAFRAFR